MSKVETYEFESDIDFEFGDYRGLFAGLENYLGEKPTLLEYHNLYACCFHSLATMFLEFSYTELLLEKKKYDFSKDKKHKEIRETYFSLKNDLNLVFSEYASKSFNIPLEEFMKKQNKTNEEIMNYINSKKNISEWRQHLIDKKFVYDDGKRVVDALKTVAAELVNLTKEPITWQFLYDNFLKDDGTAYSKRNCEDARDYANTKSMKKPKELKTH